jgi:hypothetical protein
MPEPTASQETGTPYAEPRVRHVATGHEGVRQGAVAPRLLERYDGSTRRAGGRS